MNGQLDPIQLMKTISELEYKINALATIQTGGIWTAYTPTWTATSNPDIGNGTLTGKYTIIGKTCHLNIYLLAGSTTTYGTGEWIFSIPKTASGATESGTVKILDSGTGWFDLVCKFSNTTTIYIPPVTASYPMTWAENDTLWLNITYEIT